MSVLPSPEWEALAPKSSCKSIGTILDKQTSGSTVWKPHPDIQRYDMTWKQAERDLFIDSIMFNLASQTTFVLSTRVTDGKRASYLLDGAHRLRVLCEFVGVYGRDAMFTYKGKLYTEFTHEEKDCFRNREVLVCEYTDITTRQEQELFRRVNIGLTLSAGELVNSSRSVDVCRLAVTLGQKYEDVLARMSARTGNDMSRMVDRVVMFMLIVNFHHGRMVLYEKPNLSNMEKLVEAYQDVRTDEYAIMRKVETLMTIMHDREFYFMYELMLVQHLILHEPRATVENLSEFLYDVRHDEHWAAFLRSNISSSNTSSRRNILRKATCFNDWLDS